MDVCEYINEQSSTQRFGIELESANEGQAVGMLAYDEAWCFDTGQESNLHGAVIFALADTVGGAAAMSHPPNSQHVVTKDIRMDYLAKGRADLRAEANVEQTIGDSSTVKVEIIHDNDDEVVGIARGTYVID